MKAKLGLVFLISAFLTLPVFAAENAAMDPAKMAEAKKMGAPGENHKKFESLVGNWTNTSTRKMTPDAAPMTSTGTNTNKMILGGRFLQQDFKGEAMGEAFEGTGISGYDNVKKEFTSIWMDNMMTGIMVSTGQYDASSNAITEKGTFSCPMTGEKDKEFRSVWKIIDENNYTYEMYGKGPDGHEFKNMEIVYKRQ